MRRMKRTIAGVVALLAGTALIAGCSTSSTGDAVTNVRAVLSSEDASDILPGSEGDFVVMIHLMPDGGTIPLVMLTPRTATTYAPHLITDDSVYLMEVPEGAAWPLTNGQFTWDQAIISSESQLQPDVLAGTAGQLTVAATVFDAQVDSSIIAWTQRDVSHMAGAYIIVEDECLPVVVRQTPEDAWLITEVPGWTTADEVAELVADAPVVTISDSTQVNPSRISGCTPGGK
jgi:predicted small secreted protein